MDKEKRSKILVFHSIFLFFVFLILFPEISLVLESFVNGATIVSTRTGIGNLIPIITFAATTFTLLMVTILLVTPGKKISSPIFYWLDKIGNRIYQMLYGSNKDRNSSFRKYLLFTILEVLIFFIIIVIYKFIIRSIYLSDFSIIFIIGNLFVIGFITSLNSYIVHLSIENDNNTSKSEDERVQFKYILVGAMMILSILIFYIMNSITGFVDKKLAGPEQYSAKNTIQKIISTKIELVDR